jgi:hypothetical protein
LSFVCQELRFKDASRKKMDAYHNYSRHCSFFVIFLIVFAVVLLKRFPAAAFLQSCHYGRPCNVMMTKMKTI